MLFPPRSWICAAALLFGSVGVATAQTTTAQTSGIDRLTPAPGYTPVIPTLTVLQPPTPGIRTPRAPPPRPPPPLSPPLAGTTLGRDPAFATLSAEAPASPAAASPSPAAGPPPPPVPASGERGPRYTSTEVNVRPQPREDARRIDILDEGTKVDLVGPVINGKWVKVSRRGQVLGYVSVEFLLPQPPKPH